MTTFDERKAQFEAEFAHNAELKFKVEARRDKMLGAWAAELLGLSGEAADDYAKSVVRADLEEPGDDDVFRKLRADFDAKNVSLTDEDIRAKMAEYLAEAMNDIRGS